MKRKIIKNKLKERYHKMINKKMFSRNKKKKKNKKKNSSNKIQQQPRLKN